jgi:hypothetical protein
VSVLLGLFVTGFAIAPWTVAAATSCSDGNGEVAIVGRLSSLRDATATFGVESSSASEYRSADTPLPKAGTNIAVAFSGGDEFLRVGKSYAVPLWWDQGHFVSSVSTAEDICAVRTRYADGSAIETSLLSRPEVKRLLLVVAIALFVTVGLPAIWLRQRHQQRRRRNDAELRSAAG